MIRKPSKNSRFGFPEMAVIGMAFRVPGADSPEQFWKNLREGACAFGEFPEKRKRDVIGADLFMDAREPKRFRLGNYLSEVDKFDYKFFKISPREASFMDPCQRLFLETAWHCLEDAGVDPKKIRGSKTGIFCGFARGTQNARYVELARNADQSSLYSTAWRGNTDSIMASRLAYVLDLRGPNVLINTACSSSLVALHLACQSVKSGECDQAIVGGISFNLQPLDIGLKLEIDSSGPTRSFDNGSDGTSWGEGIIAILIKPLEKAVADKDRIWAVIKGSAVNHDGKSTGVAAPNPEAQARVIEAAWQNGGIDPEKVSCMEAHGTGTKIGDPIEVEGMTRAFSRHTKRKQFCALGSVKSNIGHLHAAAGLSGVVKMILAMKHKEIPPTVNFERPNRRIAFEKSPVYVNHKLRSWESDGPRLCGVSSFGMSGTNAHVVLEEPPVNYKPKKTNFKLTKFEKTRCWLETESVFARGEKLDWPLLDFKTADSMDMAIFEINLEGKNELFSEHMIFGKSLVFGLSYLEMALEACGKKRGEPLELRDIFYLQPLYLDQKRQVQVIIKKEGGEFDFSVVSRPLGGGQWIKHVQGKVAVAAAGLEEKFDLAKIRQRCSRRVFPGKIKTLYDYRGLTVGERWHNVKTVDVAAKEALGVIDLGKNFHSDLERFIMYPFLVDSGLLPSRALGGEDPFMPVFYKKLVINGPLPSNFYSYVKVKIDQAGLDGETRVCDVFFLDQEGRVFLKVFDYTVKRADSLAKKSGADYAKFIYKRKWRQADFDPAAGARRDGSCLIFNDGSTLAAEVRKRMEETGRQVVEVRPGGFYKQNPGRIYEIGESASDYEKLVRELKSFSFGQIIFAAAKDGAKTVQGLRQKQEQNTMGLFRLAKALQKAKWKDALEMILLTRNSYVADGTESAIFPENAPFLSVGKIAMLENANLTVRSIDLDDRTRTDVFWPEILDTSAEFNFHVAYRNGRRYVQEIDSFDLAVVPGKGNSIKKDGVYLITGGLGEVGLELSRELAAKDKINLVLVSRSGLPPRTEWQRMKKNDLRAQKIKAILEIEKTGSRVFCFKADVTKAEQLKNVLAKARRIGSLKGIVHCAGMVSDRLISLKSEEEFGKVLAPKMEGTWNLADLTSNDDLDFFVLFSSMAAVICREGRSDYVAANSFMDAFAESERLKGRKILSVNWPKWKDVGMATLKMDLITPLDKKIALAVFNDALGKNIANFSVADFTERIFEYDYLAFKFAENFRSKDAKQPAQSLRKNIESESKAVVKGSGSELEKELAGIWAQILGYKEVSLSESLFEIGGDSLIALQINNAISKKMGVDLELEDIFKYSTIKKLAAKIKEAKAKRGK